MEIGPGTWVRLGYRVFDSQGEPVEEGSRTLEFRFGDEGAVFPAIAGLLAGKPAGAKLSAYLQPDDAFGDYDARWLRLAPRAGMPASLEVGMSFEGFPGEAGDDRIWTVTDIAGDTVVLDGNHPLAGMALRYDIEVLELSDEPPRDAADDRDED